MILFLALVIITLILTLLAINAPEGWEDSEGLHYGKKEK